MPWRPRCRPLIALLLASACGGSDCPSGWTSPLDRSQLDRPLLAAAGRGDEVLFVGGGLGLSGATLRRWDGAAWSVLDPGRAETLWWLWVPPAGDVWMVGERGLALRWDGATFQPVATGTAATIFGVWGAAPDDVWLVGGSPGGGTGKPNDVVLHWTGSSFAPDPPPARGTAFFKVWGAAADDVWVVGELGALWRRTASGWRSYDVGTSASLTTVHGCGASDVWAVGGQAVYHWDGAGWSPAAVTPLATAAGVHCGKDEVLVVGNGGMKLRYVRAQDRWIDDTFADPFYSDFHGAYIAPSGSLWAVGGNYNGPPNAPRMGMIGFLGCPAPR
jgi:hypothetical protein